ncbi:hypothetical protein HKX48_005268 [Thoreauomyces humboldtii]|nr:hypothetical protein HKX48_005268 [Thoreauomyces humboldtii]
MSFLSEMQATDGPSSTIETLTQRTVATATPGGSTAVPYGGLTAASIFESSGTDKASPSLISALPADVSEVTMSTALGATAGFASKKLAKTAGLLIGVGFIGVQALAHADILHVNWPKVENFMIGRVDEDGDGKLTGKDLQIKATRMLHNLTTDFPSSAGFAAAFAIGFRYG